MIFVSSQVSDGNMDFRFGDTKQVLKNRQQFFESLSINSKQIAEVQQVHGNKVIVIDNIPNPETEVDGLITNKKGVYLMLKIADCMAVAFFDPKNRVIALIHVGWRSLGKGIIKHAVLKMAKNFDSKPQDLIIQFSPSIGPCCYKMDLWEQAEKQLVILGVLEKNIDNPKICTYHTNKTSLLLCNKYFSHRKSEDQNLPEARFITILGLKNAN